MAASDGERAIANVVRHVVVSATSVIHVRQLVVVAVVGIRAPRHLLRIANAVVVDIQQAVALAIVALLGEVAIAELFGVNRIVVARQRVGATIKFQFGANAVAVFVVQAIPITVQVQRLRIQAIVCLVRRFGHVVAGFWVRATTKGGSRKQSFALKREGQRNFIHGVAMAKGFDVDHAR